MLIASSVMATGAWPDWPEYALVNDIVAAVRTFATDGPVALATLVSVSGSSPRPLGSEMAIAADGRVAGYVSGGCVEAAVALEALAVLDTGIPRLLDYGVGSSVMDIQLSCGGRIGIFVRPLHDVDRYLETIETGHARRKTLTILTDRADGTWRSRPGRHASDARSYARTHHPPLRLVMVGGDPVTLALAQLGPMLDIEVVLLRPGGPVLPPADVRLSKYDHRPLGSSLAELDLDERTAVYTLSHDEETDHHVLAAGLASPAFVVGALGSRSKSVSRSARLEEAGFSDADLSRLRAPAGSSMSVQTPHGIALSILAEICQAAAQMA